MHEGEAVPDVAVLRSDGARDVVEVLPLRFVTMSIWSQSAQFVLRASAKAMMFFLLVTTSDGIRKQKYEPSPEWNRICWPNQPVFCSGARAVPSAAANPTVSVTAASTQRDVAPTFSLSNNRIPNHSTEQTRGGNRYSLRFPPRCPYLLRPRKFA
jgi:hypothetical protein